MAVCLWRLGQAFQRPPWRPDRADSFHARHAGVAHDLVGPFTVVEVPAECLGLDEEARRAPARVLAPKDIQRLLDFVEGSEEYRDLLAPVAMLTTTGMRLGELLGLTSDQVDLARGFVMIRQSLAKRVGGGVTIGGTKTRQHRVRPQGRGMQRLLRAAPCRA